MKKVLEYIKNNKISILEIERQLGIPSARMYKWFKGSIPNAKDFLVLQEWVFQQMAKSGAAVAEPTATYLTGELANNKDGKDGLSYISLKSRADYHKNFVHKKGKSDVPKLYVPGFGYRGDKFRIFEVGDDSMLTTFRSGMQVIAEYVEPESWKNISSWYSYVLVTKDDILVKRVMNQTEQKWLIVSDNKDFYEQYFINPKQEVLEVWKVKRKLDWEVVGPRKFDVKIK